MRIYAKLALTALVALTALAALVNSASARNLSISNQNVRVTWSSLEFSALGLIVRCQVTLEGSFHSRTIVKVERTLIGHITRVTVNRPCTGGAGYAYNGSEVLSGTTLENTLPWHITYERFGGTLPNITSLSILLSNAKFLVELGGLRCIYTTGARGNATGTASRNTTTGEVEEMRAGGTITRNAESPSGGFCPTGSFGSPPTDGRITLLNSTAKITVTLI